MNIVSLNKSFGPREIFQDFSLSPPEGKTSCLLGPSGCGKTTLLNMAAGLVQPDSGDIRTAGHLSYVFQESRLLPWLTAQGNLVYPMGRRLHRTEKHRLAKEMLGRIDMEDEGDKYPRELSGGMARRIGLARALLTDFNTLLMDEPLASLDQELKEKMISLLKERLRGKTALLVTHDYHTARLLSDHIYLLTPPPVQAREIPLSRLQEILDEINSKEAE